MFYNKTLTNKMKRDTSFEEKKKIDFQNQIPFLRAKKNEEIIP